MTDFISAAPQAAALMLDLFAKAQDWPNAEEIGERLEHLLPPELRAREAAERGEPAPAEPNPQGASGASRRAAQAMQLQAAQMRLQASCRSSRSRTKARRSTTSGARSNSPPPRAMRRCKGRARI